MKAYDDMDYAQIECPECAKQITVESSAAVENIACPYCKFTVVIPPSLQEPMLQEPMLQEPMLQEPMSQEPMSQEPMLQEPMSQASTGIENSEPDIQVPLLENFSVETLSSDAKNESGVDINQVEKTRPPIIEREIPIATPVETRKNELDLPEESRFEKFLICVAFLVAIAAAWAFFL